MSHMNMAREGPVFPAPGHDTLARLPRAARAPALLEYAPVEPAAGRHRHRHRHSARIRPSSTARLRSAIEQRQLSLHYQPQYETRGGRQCGVEALARWLLPNGVSISPMIFIPQAEKSGLIGALGAWVLREACATVVAWQPCSENLPTLCVNVSPRQISREFCAILATTLERTGFPAGRLELEITEGILLEQTELALECLAEWKRLGVRVALDDFGTGYSSLSYLSRLPVDRVKIDKSLIHRMTTDAKTAAIVRAVVSLGADLGFAVLAEGVESEAQLTMLNDMGCEQAQGYLLAMPACADEARELLEAPWGNRSSPKAFTATHIINGSSNAC